jgi:hypothetical protein
LKITQKTVDAIRPGKRRFIWDDALSGFGVRITEGSASYVVDFRLGAKRRRIALHPISQSTLSAARERAQEILVGARRGEDLTVNPRKGEPTFNEVWRSMIDEVDKPKLSPETIADYEDRARRLILPRIGSKGIGDVTAVDVDKAVAAATGNRNRAYVATLIKKTINHAKPARLLPDNHRNPAADVAVKRSAREGRALEIEDVARFGAALAAMEAEGKISALARQSAALGACLWPQARRSPHTPMVSRESAAAKDDSRGQDRRSRGRLDRCGGGDSRIDASRAKLRVRLRRAALWETNRRGSQDADGSPDARRNRALSPL